MDENLKLWFGLGFLSSIAIVAYVPIVGKTISSLSGCSKCKGNRSLRLENIAGINQNTLAIARRRGF